MHRTTRPTGRSRIVLAGLAATAAALAAAPPAPAATLERTAANNIFFTADAGENNDLGVKVVGADVVFKDTVPVTDIGGCVQVNATTAKCAKANLDGVYIFVQDGTNEVHSATGFPTYISGLTAVKNSFRTDLNALTTLYGGPGPDTLQGGSAKDYIYGGDGPDLLIGSSGADELKGGDGDDQLRPGLGADLVSGEAGVDTVSYAERFKPVRVTLFDNLANDGIIGEHDTVKSDVENVVGTARKDKITGSAAANRLIGGNSADTIYGGAGPDHLQGDGGDDVLHGQDGDDKEYGGLGDDYVEGGGGADVLYGEVGRDRVVGDVGEDTLNGGPGEDELRGGAHDDALFGIGENDVLIGDAGADKLSGGDGVDTVSYAGSANPVTADLDGVNYDDGPVGEGDSIAPDVESLVGGSGADVLTGNASLNEVRGGPGNDTIDGLGAADHLFGEAGDDTLLSQDGAADIADCGDGQDLFTADAIDTLVACEPPAPVDGGGQNGGGQNGGGQNGGGQNGGGGEGTVPAASTLRLGPGRVRLTHGGRIRLELRCVSSTSKRCAGSVTIRRKIAGRIRTIGTRRFSTQTGAKAVVSIKVSRSTLTAVRRRGVRVQAVAKSASTAGKAARSIVILRARR